MWPLPGRCGVAMVRGFGFVVSVNPTTVGVHRGEYLVWFWWPGAGPRRSGSSLPSTFCNLCR